MVLPCSTVPWVHYPALHHTVTTRWLHSGGQRREEHLLSNTSRFFTARVGVAGLPGPELSRFFEESHPGRQVDKRTELGIDRVLTG